MREQIKYLLSESGKTGAEKLFTHMDQEGFFEAPCSGDHHLAKEGGLAEHSLNVYHEMLLLDKTFKAGLDMGSIIICGILHDIGKMGDYHKPNYVPNILKTTGKQSDKKPFETNKDLLYIPHEVRSIAIIERFISLTEDEEFAILYHNGMYGDLKYSYSGKETPLSMILHFADMWVSRITEV